MLAEMENTDIIAANRIQEQIGHMGGKKHLKEGMNLTMRTKAGHRAEQNQFKSTL